MCTGVSNTLLSGPLMCNISSGCSREPLRHQTAATGPQTCPGNPRANSDSHASKCLDAQLRVALQGGPRSCCTDCASAPCCTLQALLHRKMWLAAHPKPTEVRDSNRDAARAGPCWKCKADIITRAVSAGRRDLWPLLCGTTPHTPKRLFVSRTAGYIAFDYLCPLKI